MTGSNLSAPPRFPLTMHPSQAAAEIAVLADDLRDGANPKAVAAKLSALVDRLRGLPPLPDPSTIRLFNGRRTRRQAQRPAFGL